MTCNCIGFEHDPDVQPIFGIEPGSWLMLPVEQRREGHRQLVALANVCRKIKQESKSARQVEPGRVGIGAMTPGERGGKEVDCPICGQPTDGERHLQGPREPVCNPGETGGQLHG